MSFVGGWAARWILAGGALGASMPGASIAAISEPYCSGDTCYITSIAYDAAVYCMLIVIPVGRDGAVAGEFLDRADVEMGAKLFGEQCAETKHFPVAKDEVAQIGRAIEVLEDAIRNQQHMFQFNEVDSESRSCFLRGCHIEVVRAEHFQGEDGVPYVIMEVDACDQQFEVTVDMSGPHEPGSVSVGWHHQTIDFDDSWRKKADGVD